MATVPETPGGDFQVVFSELHRQQVRELGAKARRLGVLTQYLSALTTIIQELERDPIGWGDPRNVLPGRGVLLCQRAYSLLLVRYGVDEAARKVFVTAVLPMPGKVLETEP